MRSSTNWRTGRRARGALAGATAVGALALAAGAARAADCGDLAGKTYGEATILAATTVSPPSSLMGLDPPAPVAIHAPFCRVEGLLKTSDRSHARFEVWLPEKGAWNGKIQGVGNGGFAGSLILAPMDWALQAGYAVSATDTGHTGGTLDAAWALGHPEEIVDFGWRAIHETAEASKAVVADYYQKPQSHAYFSGCSDGGREALMEAQRFPKDYDGIVAGAPANFWTKLLTNAIWSEQALNQPGAWLSPAKLAIVSKAVFAECHGESGYVEDPAECHFDPASLVCKAGQSKSCLTDSEAAALKKIYSGAEDASGKPLFPGYAPGGEDGPTAWVLWITGSDPNRTAGSLMNGFGTGFFANMVFDNAGLAHRRPERRRCSRRGGGEDGRDAGCVEPRSRRLQGRRRQAHPVSWLGQRRDSSAKLDRLLRSGREQDGRPQGRPILLSAVHGAGHGSLRRRTGPERDRRGVRPALNQPRSGARRRRRACPLGRGRGRAGRDRRDAVIATTIPRRGSRPSGRGAPIRPPPITRARATEATPRVTPARRRRNRAVE